jgi:hypothetical protein
MAPMQVKIALIALAACSSKVQPQPAHHDDAAIWARRAETCAKAPVETRTAIARPCELAAERIADVLAPAKCTVQDLFDDFEKRTAEKLKAL